MSRQNYNPPSLINSTMVPLICGAFPLTQGEAVCCGNPGEVLPQSNLDATGSAIGIAMNNAQPGETVFVQVAGLCRVPCKNTGGMTTGDYCGSATATATDPSMNDLGQSFSPISTLTAGMSVVGLIVAFDATTVTVMVMPFDIPTVVVQGITSPTNVVIQAGTTVGILDGTNSAINMTNDGGITLQPSSNTKGLIVNSPVTPGKFTVATLPAGTEGMLAYATDGRKTGEGVGAGTGVPVYFSNTHWRVFSTDAAVAA